MHLGSLPLLFRLISLHLAIAEVDPCGRGDGHKHPNTIAMVENILPHTERDQHLTKTQMSSRAFPPPASHKTPAGCLPRTCGSIPCLHPSMVSGDSQAQPSFHILGIESFSQVFGDIRTCRYIFVSSWPTWRHVASPCLANASLRLP